MKKITLFVLALLVGMCVMTVPGYAQFTMKVGPLTGMNFNIHSGSDLKQTGTGVGFMIGGEADMMFSSTVGILTRLTLYDNKSGSYSESGTTQGYNYTADVSWSVAYFQIEPLFKFKIPHSGFYFVAGPSLGINVEGSQETTIKIEGYQDQKNKGSIKDMQARFEIKAGAGYDFSISRGLEISPELMFGYGLTKVVSDVSWRILSIQAAASVKFSVL